MAQEYQVTLLSEGQQQFSEPLLQLAASNRLGSPQATYNNRKEGFSLLVFGLFFLILMPVVLGVQASEGFHPDFASLLVFLLVLALFLLSVCSQGVSAGLAFFYAALPCQIGSRECCVISGCRAAPALLAYVEPGANPL